jgi:hypothetical protein
MLIPIYRFVAIAAGAALLTGLSLASQSGKQPASKPMVIPVVVVNYFPVDGDKIDIKTTGDWGDTYLATKAKCEGLTRDLVKALGEGSRYHGYKDKEATPSLKFEVVGTYVFKEAIPTCPLKVDERAPKTDYNAIMKKIGIQTWVEKKGVKEVWIWGYDGGKVRLLESNMSSPTGDVSNSDRDNADLPILKSTYTVYHYNYQRALGEAIEDHMHQLEAILNWVDGRDRTPAEKWPDLLFWGKFVGSDVSHKIVTNPARCGWTHYAPNSEHDYDWRNTRYVETDIEDWHPDYVGKTQKMNCERWNNDPIQWRVYWLQAIPGMSNGLTYKGKALRNWWTFVYDWDRAQREKWTLTY